jgi:hypothetical protein
MSTSKNAFRASTNQKTHNYRQKTRQVFITMSREALNENELSVKEGDLVHIKVNPEYGWWEGELNGKMGWLPIEVSQDLLKTESGTEPYEVSLCRYFFQQ